MPLGGYRVYVYSLFQPYGCKIPINDYYYYRCYIYISFNLSRVKYSTLLISYVVFILVRLVLTFNTILRPKLM